MEEKKIAFTLVAPFQMVMTNSEKDRVGGKIRQTTRPQTSMKTAWRNTRADSGVEGRFHDPRHTFVTDLAESGAGDQVIQDIAGHVSKDMVKHYSHIRTEAKRRAVEKLVAEH